jgi:hypothetical protein
MYSWYFTPAVLTTILWVQYRGSAERERNSLSKKSETVAEDAKSSLFRLYPPAI